MVHAMKTVVEFFSQYTKLVSPRNFGLPCSDAPGALIIKFYVFCDAMYIIIYLLRRMHVNCCIIYVHKYLRHI